MNKQDSNLTSLRFAEEESPKTMADENQPWYALEPNSYGDFGGQLSSVARNPINARRQRRKGTLTDMDVTGNFNQDLTINNLTRLLQGFFFADAREKATTAPLNGTADVVTSVTGSTHKFNFTSYADTFVAGDLVKSSGFGVAANNGTFLVASADSNDITTSAGLADEASPPAAAMVETVGFQLGSGTSAITLNGNLARLTDSAKDMTTLGLIVGEWIYLGADDNAQRFANNGGFARVSAIATGYLEFDKTSWDAEAEAGTGKTIRIWLGLVLKNEGDPTLIKRRTYQLERYLGTNDSDQPLAEYLTGMVANELTINIAQADKITMDLTFVGLDHEILSGDTALKSAGNEVAAPGEEALNTSNDFSRIMIGGVSTLDSYVAPWFAFVTDMTLTVNNNVSPLKAIGVFGGFDLATGTFEVGGSAEAYFSDIAGLNAVRAFQDVTLDFAVVKRNTGILWDIPLLSFGDGRLNVEQDQAIKMPLENSAAESAYGHTLLMQRFAYLPSVAEA